MLKIIILTLKPVLDSKLKKWLDLRSQKINKIHKNMVYLYDNNLAVVTNLYNNS